MQANSGIALRALCDFRFSLFFDGGDDYFFALCSSCIEHQKGKATIAGNKTEWAGSHRELFNHRESIRFRRESEHEGHKGNRKDTKKQGTLCVTFFVTFVAIVFALLPWTREASKGLRPPRRHLARMNGGRELIQEDRLIAIRTG